MLRESLAVAIVAPLALLSVAAGAGQGARPPGLRTSPQVAQWTQPASPSVLATFIQRDGETAAILLWRGTPGWFLGGPRRGSGGGSGDLIRGTETVGNVRLEYELARTTAQVQGVAVDMPDGTALILIDHVDEGAGEVKVTGVTARLPVVAREKVEAAFMAMPEALAFLRCGETLPDPQLQTFNRIVCDKLAR